MGVGDFVFYTRVIFIRIYTISLVLEELVTRGVNPATRKLAYQLSRISMVPFYEKIPGKLLKDSFIVRLAYEMY